MAVFGVARATGTELAEILELVQRRLLVTGQVQQTVQQHGAVTGGQNEAVAVRPVRFGRVELQKLGKQNGRDVRHAHRHAGVAGIGFLHAFGGQKAQRVR